MLPETIPTYLDGSDERGRIKHALEHLTIKVQTEVPCILGGRSVGTGKLREQRLPYARATVIGVTHEATPDVARQAMDAAKAALPGWSRLPSLQRAGLVERAAALARDSWRGTLNAAAMVGLGKTIRDAEEDATAGLINALQNLAAAAVQREAATVVTASTRASSKRRPLGGVVVCATASMMLADAAVKVLAPVVAGNTVVWKPGRAGGWLAHFLMRVLREAGLPDGVLNLVPGDGASLLPVMLAHPACAGLSFDGSNASWRAASSSLLAALAESKAAPRLRVTATGASYLVAHPDSDVMTLAAACVRGAFGDAGQRRGSLKHAYIPKSLHDLFRPTLQRLLRELKSGNVEDFTTYVGCVASQEHWEACKTGLEALKAVEGVKVLMGGKVDDAKGWLVEPTVVMAPVGVPAQVFPGPVLAVHFYEDNTLPSLLETLAAEPVLAGAISIFARSRLDVETLVGALGGAAINVSIQDAPPAHTWDQQALADEVAAWSVAGAVVENMDPPFHFSLPHMAKA